jgi:isopenicillin N synthase-like dioxygenase
MENIFEQNLKDLKSLEVDSNSGKHKIDLLDVEDEEEEPQDLDEDEKIIKLNIKKNNFESIFGIEGQESAVSAGLRKSRDFFSKQSSSKLRTSIAGKYFFKRETESEFSK